MIYLDYAATSPMCAEALEAYRDAAVSAFGNASSLHDEGDRAARCLEWSRGVIASLLDADPGGLYFTGSGSEANALALWSLAHAGTRKGRHVIVSDAEHACVRAAAERLRLDGFDVSFAPVDADGIVSPEAVEALIREDTILVSVAHANSETGTLQPLEPIGRAAAARNIPFHSDCVQTFGKVPIRLREWGLSAISVSAHKLSGPKGLGLAVIDPALRWTPYVPGATHERGFRMGTVDVPAAAAFAAAARKAFGRMEEESARWRSLLRRFVERVRRHGWDLVVEGHRTRRAPHIAGLRVPGIPGQELMLALNRRGVAVSPGTACHAALAAPSRTLTAMGRSEDEARELFRVSVGPETAERDIDAAADALHDALREAREHRGGVAPPEGAPRHA